jgi:hypothetical protein
MKMKRTYSELRRLTSFEDRFHYLQLKGSVSAETFGVERYLNQQFYRSKQWKDIRTEVIARDEAMDLGIPGREIFEARNIIVHHMNPMTPEELHHGEEHILDPEFLISTTLRTHNAIHYGDSSSLIQLPVERRPGDTRLW